MHTSSLSGTITEAIYSDIFPWGILEHKQRYFECVCGAFVCVCAPSMRGNQICSLQSDRDWIELAVCCCGCQWRPIVDREGDRRQHSLADSGTHFPNVAFPALKLYLEITASTLSSPAICCPSPPSVYFWKSSDLSILLSTLPPVCALILPIYLSIRFFPPAL